MSYKRTGECNQCGQCCGADGSPNQDNPWPGGWPGTFRDKQYGNVISLWPHGPLFGVEKSEKGTPIVPVRHGVAEVDGVEYPYVWIEGHAVCKDVSPKRDGSKYSLECPFLAPDPGDDTRPCSLVGTSEQRCFDVACKDFTGGIPPKVIATKHRLDQWSRWHPKCSYVYVAEVE